MAIVWINQFASGANNGTTEADAFTSFASRAFLTGNQYNIRAGTVLDWGSLGGTGGNNLTLLKYGDGPNPIITSTAAANFWSVATANTPILIDGIDFVKGGAIAGTGLNVSQIRGAGSFTHRNARVEGFIKAWNADRSNTVILDNMTVNGGSSSYGIQAIMNAGDSCTGWRIRRTTFNCGAGLNFKSSDNASFTGAWTDMEIADCIFPPSSTSAISFAVPLSQNSPSQQCKVDGPSKTVYCTIPWTQLDGRDVFLAGFGDRVNCNSYVCVSTSGIFDAGNGGYPAVFSGPPMASEGYGYNKGIHLRDTTRMFNNIRLLRNNLRGQEETPINLTGIVGGLASGNTIADALTTGTKKMSAGMELINSVGLILEDNDVSNIVNTNPAWAYGDAQGIQVDGACEGTTVRWNRVSDCPGSFLGASNSGCGLAVFESKGTVMHSNLSLRNFRGFWAGGPGSSVDSYNNDYVDCNAGYVINSSPLAGAIKLRNSLVMGCAVTGTNDASALISNMSYWNNAAGSNLGAAPSTTNPMVSASYKPLPGSPLLTGGVDLGPVRDFNRRQGRKFVGAYTAAKLMKRV